MAATRQSDAPQQDKDEAFVKTMTAMAYRKIRRLILDTEWAPGFQATEQEVATSLGMSRTPVREALMRLQQEGLVSVIPRHGMRVLPVSTSDMKEIYEILTSLESTAAELAAGRKLTDDQLRTWTRRLPLTTSTDGPRQMQGSMNSFWNSAATRC